MSDLETLMNAQSSGPDEWRQAVVLRCAARIFPQALSGIGLGDGGERLGNSLLISLFRAQFFAFCSIFSDDAKSSSSLRNAASKCIIPASHSSKEYYAAVMAVNSVVQACSKRCSWEDAVVSIGHAAEKNDEVCQDLASQILLDRDLVEQTDDAGSGLRLLRQSPLWTGSTPRWFEGRWVNLKSHLHKREQHFEVWSEWFDKRIHGSDFVFGLGPRADHFLMLRLADQAQAFWSRDPQVINSDIKNWITEALGKTVVSPNQIKSKIPQNKLAISWKADVENSKIRVDTTKNRNFLRSDAEAHLRHAEAVYEAKRLLEQAVYYHNSLGDIGLDIQRYLDAMGDDLSQCIPSLSVHRGEKLRQIFALKFFKDRYSIDPTLSSELQEAFVGWRSAHNVFVGLDPTLEKMDRAVFGPDQAHSIISTGDVTNLANAMKDRLLIDKPEYDTLNDLVTFNVAPEISNERHERWMSESARNVLIEAVNLAWKYPKASIALVGASILAGPVAVATTAAGAITAATFIKDFRPMLLNIFCDSPTILALIDEITKQSKK